MFALKLKNPFLKKDQNIFVPDYSFEPSETKAGTAIALSGAQDIKHRAMCSSMETTSMPICTST